MIVIVNDSNIMISPLDGNNKTSYLSKTDRDSGRRKTKKRFFLEYNFLIIFWNIMFMEHMPILRRN